MMKHDRRVHERRQSSAIDASRQDESATSGKAQGERNLQLMQVNEQLVITSVQLQRANEAIEASNAKLNHLVQHDFLTDLPNRIQLYDRIAMALAFAKRYRTKLVMLFLDLDRFKIINDSLGHAIGDQLLQSVAQRLTSAIRSSDTVSRQGGDEFVLLLSDLDQDAILLTIEKIHKIVTAPYCIAGHDLRIGATIGISIFPKDGEDGETLLRHADAAMYYAKENGRNKYQFFTEDMQTRELELRDLEMGLYQALDKQQFVLFYQAQLDLESGVITGAEALLRWRHPGRGLLLPTQFVPVAEASGAIVAIGRWVLREACRQAQAWIDAGLTLNVIAVNISVQEFGYGDFLENVRTVLQETGLAPARLELELTETVLMKNFEGTIEILAALRSMGVRISIDDFGTGYSSLSYLQRFLVNTMKIDQSFVRDLLSADDSVLLTAIIGLGKNLSYQVVAEGVETPKQLAFLREHHCAVVQGFYVNVPMIADEFAILLKQGVPENIWHHAGR